jgi:hypothetical protein
MQEFPPLAATLLLIAAGVILIIGFSRHGFDFFKHGFKQTVLATALENKLESIELNHFGHLKNYLGIMNGVLLDKKIIDNETKARMDNELRGL